LSKITTGLADRASLTLAYGAHAGQPEGISPRQQRLARATTGVALTPL